jgi:mannose-1-phosphate guanylyltransferase
MVVLPSDHLLEDGQVWADCLGAAVAAAREGYLVTIGITPTRAETGYGYIRAAEPLTVLTVGGATPHVAAEFVEKPDAERARRA